MNCPNCGTVLPDGAAFCSGCGTPIAQAQPAVAQPAQPAEPVYAQPAQPTYQQPAYQQQYAQPGQPAAPAAYTPAVPGSKSKIAAGLLAILLGALGIHKFYLGYTKAGVIMLLVSLLTLGIGAVVMEIIGIIEGIMYLTKDDLEFYQTYELGQKQWF